MKLRVREHPGLVRDSRSKAIINIDEKSFNEYQSKKNMQDKVSNLEEEVKNIKNSLEEIKAILLSTKN